MLLIEFYGSMSSLSDDLSTQRLEKPDIQGKEDKWWHFPSVPYLKYGDVPQLSRWLARVIPGTTNMTLAVDGHTLNFPRQWISICFLLDLQQLSSLSSAILHATSTPIFSERLYCNVCFIDNLRAHVIQSRLEVSSKEFNENWMPASLERWLRRQLHCLPNERGAYKAHQERYNEVYRSKLSIWNLGNLMISIFQFKG
jgi:hypothetical protein